MHEFSAMTPWQSAMSEFHSEPPITRRHPPPLAPPTAPRDEMKEPGAVPCRIEAIEEFLEDLAAQWCPLFFFGFGFPSKIANLTKGALMIIWLLGYQEDDYQPRYGQSLGAKGHGRGKCTPCTRILIRPGCEFGARCMFCHLEHPGSPVVPFSPFRAF